MIFDRREWLAISAATIVKLLGPPTATVPIETEEETSSESHISCGGTFLSIPPSECDIRYHPSVERYATAVWKAGA